MFDAMLPTIYFELTAAFSAAFSAKQPVVALASAGSVFAFLGHAP